MCKKSHDEDLNASFKASQEASANVFNAVMAGIEISKKSKNV
jgi:hypothetical protein